MVADLQSTAFRLWRTSPPWRFSVISAGLVSVLALADTLMGPSGTSYTPSSSTSPPVPPPIIADPASDARLAAYEGAYNDAAKVKEAGARCEQVSVAFAALTAEDKVRGHNIRLTSAPRLAALSGGEQCSADIAKSNAHFATLAKAVATAESAPSVKSLQDAVQASKVLDAFDQSRPGYGSDGSPVAKAKGYVTVLADSAARIDALTREADGFARDRSPPAYLRLAEAARQLTDFDRSRLTDAQKPALAAATEAATTLRDSRARLARVPQLLAAAERDKTPAAQQALIEATAAVTPFDEAVATPEQKQSLDHARTVAAPWGWSLLEQRLASFGRNASPANYTAVAAIYGVLKNVPSADLTDAQRRLLAQGREAVDTLAASDARLQRLVAATAAWQQQGLPAGSSVAAALQAITPFDQSRFEAPQKQAYDMASRADAIVRGPELGLTPATKNRMRILVTSSKDTQLDKKVAEALRAGLRRAGFPIAADRKEAALLADVAVESAGDPQSDFSGTVAGWRADARLQLGVTWAADDSTLLGGAVAQSARGQDRGSLSGEALQKAVDEIVRRFQALADQHQ